MEWIHSEIQTSEMCHDKFLLDESLKVDVPSTWDVLVNLGAIYRSATMIIS